MIVITVLSMPIWFAWLCWQMGRWKKIEYVVYTIAISVLQVVALSSINKIPFYWRIINACISIFLIILLGIGDVPVQLGPRSFKTKWDFVKYYLEDIILNIPFGIMIFFFIIVAKVILAN